MSNSSTKYLKEATNMNKSLVEARATPEIPFEPLWDYILFEKIVVDMTPGGIALPDGSKLDGLSMGKVVKAGQGAYRESGYWIPNPIKEGDTIYLMGHVKPFSVKLNGKTYFCIACRDCVAIVARANGEKPQCAPVVSDWSGAKLSEERIAEILDKHTKRVAEGELDKTLPKTQKDIQPKMG